MGVKNLWDVLEPCKQTLPLHHIQNKRICVDLSCWVIQLYSVGKSRNALSKPHLWGLFHRLRALIALNCSIIFVADGAIPALKMSTYKRRLGLSSAVSKHEMSSDFASSKRRNMGSAFSRMIEEAKMLGLALGIPCLEGLEEAEAQCALLNSENICDGCFSADSDAFLFGAKTIYRDIFLGDGGYVICYQMIDIERRLCFGRNSLITLALILGSDYSQGLRGVGLETACQFVKSIGDAHALRKIVSEDFDIKKMVRCFKNAMSLNCHANKSQSRGSMNEERKQNPGEGNRISRVIDAYLNPKCHSADSEAVLIACKQRPFQRYQLQDLCAKFFGWAPEKTDEYILPKIAERSLRRYANLHTTLSMSGIQVSLEMPVTCPVSAILNRRKSQRKECFEVSWRGIDGLETSIVPGDLLESACSEKITEFIEKKAIKGKKAKKSRQRKSVEKVTADEVDLQLKALVLSIDSENDSPVRAVAWNDYSDETGRNSDIIDLVSPSPSTHICNVARHRQVDHKSAVDSVAIGRTLSYSDVPDGQEWSKFQYSVCSGNINKDSIPESSISYESVDCDRSMHPIVTIDLCNYASDSSDENHPDVRAGEAAKTFQRSAPQHPDAIDVLDSDIDSSPDHQRKSRELRTFINGIRGDLP